MLSGATFRLIMWVVVTALAAGYKDDICRKSVKPESSLTYKSDDYFRSHIKKTSDENKKFMLGHKLILVEMLAVLVWIVWGVTQKAITSPEIASQFFVMGLVAGNLAVLSKLDGMKVTMSSLLLSNLVQLIWLGYSNRSRDGQRILLVLGDPMRLFLPALKYDFKESGRHDTVPAVIGA